MIDEMTALLSRWAALEPHLCHLSKDASMLPYATFFDVVTSRTHSDRETIWLVPDSQSRDLNTIQGAVLDAISSKGGWIFSLRRILDPSDRWIAKISFYDSIPKAIYRAEAKEPAIAALKVYVDALENWDEGGDRS